MTFVETVTLRDRGVRLEPLDLSHEAGLAAAAADGELWKIRVTSVPEPGEVRSYIETALLGRDQGQRILTNKAGSRTREFPFRHFWEGQKKRSRNQRIQNAVTDKLDPLIVLGGKAAMRQRLFKSLTLYK